MQKFRNLEFYIPLIISVYLIFAFRFKMFVMPFSYSETEFLSENIFNSNGELQLFAHKLPNIPALLYYLIFSIFDTNITAIRIAASVIGIILIFVVFKFVNFFFGKQAGIFAATLMIVQNIFLAQFATVQPEIINTILLLSAFYCFLREKYRTMCIWLILAININISGILAIFFLLISFLIKRNTPNKSQSLVFFLIPIVISATAEAVNYMLFGELSVLKYFTLENFADNLVINLNFTFILQQRLALSLILIIAFIAAIVQHQIEGYEVKTYIYTTVFMILIIIAESLAQSQQLSLLVSVTLLAIITGALLSSINIFYAYKYIIINILIIFFAIFAARNHNTSSEYISHTDQTETDIKAINYINEMISANDTIMCSNSYYKMLRNKYLGYISERLTNIDTIYCPTHYRYLIKGKDLPSSTISATLLDDNCLLEKSFTKRNAETDIFSIE